MDDPAKGPSKDNIAEKKTGDACRHLKKEADGTFSCAIHDKPWYKETPCFSHGQIEKSKKDACRMGQYLKSKGKSAEDFIGKGCY